MAPLIRIIGSLNADMVSVTSRFPEPGETITATSFTTSAGGKGANQAVACGRLSRSNPSTGHSSSSSPIHVEMVGAVGGRDGHFQALLGPTLEKSGLDTARIRTVDDDYTGVAVIIVDSSAGGENRILFSPGANYSGMQAIPDVLSTGLAPPIPDVIVMQGEIPIATVIGILREIAQYKEQKKGIEAGPQVMFNPAPAPPGGLPEDVYTAVDHLVMNETEAELMAPQTVVDAQGAALREQVAQYFHGLGVTYVVVTLGAKGVWYSVGDKASRFSNEMPAAKASQVVDTTAAGDTFIGGYATHIARWREQHRNERLNQDAMDAAMKRAVRASARCVERPGAMDSIPWEDEI